MVVSGCQASATVAVCGVAWCQGAVAVCGGVLKVPCYCVLIPPVPVASFLKPRTHLPPLPTRAPPRPAPHLARQDVLDDGGVGVRLGVHVGDHRDARLDDVGLQEHKVGGGLGEGLGVGLGEGSGGSHRRD